MCGIGGWLGNFGEGPVYAREMVRALTHRGPDAHGIELFDGALLVHTRLSIIDLSETGAQPMRTEGSRIWTVFNGEIYNHRELRRQLEARGCVFRGRSDTEVLGHLYLEYGPEFIVKLRGMFAFAIYDEHTRHLLLARDKFGIKPLFYALTANGIAFASELRALLLLPGIDKRPDTQAISDFTALAYIPAPETFYTGIRALEPGQFLEATLTTSGLSCNIRGYHAWSIPAAPELPLAQAIDKVDELINAAVERQLESDVPLGALLSGGIDSSLTSAAAQRALQGELQTFNVQFSDNQFDETWAAKTVAKHIGSAHETFSMSNAAGSFDHVEQLLTHSGQPFADTSIFAVNAISRLMRERVTVAVSGDGGDEAFGGYDVYWRLARINRCQALPPVFMQSAAGALHTLSWFGVSSRRLSQRVLDLAHYDDTAVITSLFSFMTPREQASLRRTDRDVLPVERFFERRWASNGSQKTSRLDRLFAHAAEVNARVTLPNDFLFKVDIASMKEGLEVRVPMLDEDLFSFGLSLPRDMKVKHRTGKLILRQVAARHLPASIATKPKLGFAVPLESWLGADFRANVRDSLLHGSNRLQEFFSPAAYRPMVETFCEGGCWQTLSKDELCARIIMLLSVELSLANLSS